MNGEITGRSADAGTYVEKAHAGSKSHLVGEFNRGQPAPRVELVDWSEIVRCKLSDVQA